jgi:hypothetical protein
LNFFLGCAKGTKQLKQIKMNITYKNKSFMKQIHLVIGLVVILLHIAGCTEMDHTYEHFWEDGERIYPAPADSVKVYPGKNRIGLSWLILGDPKVSKAKIFWNNENDSLEIPIESTGRGDTINTLLTDMQERSYAFTIYTFDDKGNKSIPVSAVGNVYGELYSNSLLSRVIESSIFLNDTLIIEWGDPADETTIGDEVAYLDTTGATQSVQVAPDEESTIISDYDYSADPNISYRTAYLPDSLAIDTFYTNFVSAKVKGPAIDLPKSEWTATASSYDERHGTARAPESAIDNDPSTIWVNQISTQTYYPHTLTVDMGSKIDGVEGISFLVGNRNETPRNVELLVSEDGEEWITMGLHSLQKTGTPQYLDFPEPQDIQFFRMIAIDSYGSVNIVIYEIGAFTR